MTVELEPGNFYELSITTTDDTAVPVAYQNVYAEYRDLEHGLHWFDLEDGEPHADENPLVVRQLTVDEFDERMDEYADADRAAFDAERLADSI